MCKFDILLRYRGPKLSLGVLLLLLGRRHQLQTFDDDGGGLVGEGGTLAQRHVDGKLHGVDLEDGCEGDGELVRAEALRGGHLDHGAVARHLVVPRHAKRPADQPPVLRLLSGALKRRPALYRVTTRPDSVLRGCVMSAVYLPSGS